MTLRSTDPRRGQVEGLRRYLRETATTSLSLGRYLCTQRAYASGMSAAIVLLLLAYATRDSATRFLTLLTLTVAAGSSLITILAAYASRSEIPGFNERNTRSALRLVARYGKHLQEIPVNISNMNTRMNAIDQMLSRYVMVATSGIRNPDNTARAAAMTLCADEQERLTAYLKSPQALEESMDILNVRGTPKKIAIYRRTGGDGHGEGDAKKIALRVCLDNCTLDRGDNMVLLEAPEGLRQHLHTGGWSQVGEWVGPVEPEEVEIMATLWDHGRSEVYSTAPILYQAAKTL